MAPEDQASVRARYDAQFAQRGSSLNQRKRGKVFAELRFVQGRQAKRAHILSGLNAYRERLRLAMVATGCTELEMNLVVDSSDDQLDSDDGVEDSACTDSCSGVDDPSGASASSVGPSTRGALSLMPSTAARGRESRRTIIEVGEERGRRDAEANSIDLRVYNYSKWMKYSESHKESHQWYSDYHII